jgi:hypothetical protein
MVGRLSWKAEAISATLTNRAVCPAASWRSRGSEPKEPMQGLVKDIFELNRCWMRGNDNNRWLFAAMGLTIQMHQLEAFKQGKSTWNIKERVLG